MIFNYIIVYFMYENKKKFFSCPKTILGISKL
nr:MAG TPA: hypothetical protein [Caudoviricetes sp.]